MVKFKDFSRPLSVFQVLFKENFIFKDFSRQSCIFKYFYEPVRTLAYSGLFFMFLLSSANFFQNNLFQKVLSGTLSEIGTVN